MTAPVRVLWLTKGLGRGGAEMLLLGLARAIDPAAVRLHVGYVLPHKDALVTPLTEAGAVVHCLGAADGRTAWPLRLRRLLAEGKFDVVHTHAPVVGAAARVLAPAHSVLLHTEHNLWGRYRRPTRWANAATLNRNDTVWAVSEGVARSIRPWPVGRQRAHIGVMLHGIDPTQAHRGPAARAAALVRLGLSDGPFTVGTVGNLTAKKDHDTLLRALVSVRRQVPQARLVVVGTGPREQHLRGLARDLGVGDAVHFTGIRDDVPQLLPAFDVFAMSSLHEGLSIALLEALAAGLPVVSTAVGGIPEVITDAENGLLVTPGDASALALALCRLATDARLRDQLAASAPARAAQFGIQPAATTLTDRYLALARRRAPVEGIAS